MGRLSHIEDVEQRVSQETAQVRQQEPVVSEPAPAVAEPVAKSAPAKTRAQQQADFHGLNSESKASGGHTALVIVAVVIFAVVAVQIANYTLHFF